MSLGPEVLVVFGVSFLSLTGACVSGPQVLPSAIRDEPRLAVRASRSVDLAEIKRIDPKSFDLRSVLVSGGGCTLIDGTRVDLFSKQTTWLTEWIRVQPQGGAVREIAPPFAAKLRSEKGYGAHAGLACIGSEFYFVDPVLGYIAAFHQNGDVLWKRGIPFFGIAHAAAFGSAPEQESDFSNVLGELRTVASIVTQVMHDEERLIAIGHKTGSLGFSYTLFDVTGAIVGQIGPSDLVLSSFSRGRATFVGGGGTDIRSYVPRYQVDTEIHPIAFQSELSHFLAWLYPRVTDREPALSSCFGRSPDEIKYWLGDSYDEVAARKSLAVLQRLGPAWVEKLAKSADVAATLGTFDPLSGQWIAELRRSLQAARAEFAYVEMAYFDTPLPELETRLLDLDLDSPHGMQ